MGAQLAVVALWLAFVLRIEGRFDFDLWSILNLTTSNVFVEDEPGVFLWPMPAEVTHGHTSVMVDPNLELAADGPGGNSLLISEAFQRYKQMIFVHHSQGLGSSVRNVSKGGEVLLRRLIVKVSSNDETLQLGTDESYHLSVPSKSDKSEAYLEAYSVYGALHGLETFSQLCTFNFLTKMVEIHNSMWDIRDKPRFKFRGLLIDTSRHYLPIDVIKQVIDSMAYAKLNILHWHIIDEESFPLEIPTFEFLWKGAYSVAERYTVDDAQEIAEYARVRGISVMAEMDVPGHAASWGYGYPELWPSFICQEPLDVSNNFTFDVIDGILADMRKIFPFGLFHLGGDEVNTSCWTSTPHIRKWLLDHQMSEHDAYTYFVLRAQRLALSYGWDPVNWEETFNEFSEKLHPRTIVHNWLGPAVAPKVVAKGFRCIVSNQDVWYLDHLDVPWESFYLNEPLEGIDDAAQQKLVIGGEVCMWGETVDASDIQQTIWPRAAAAAERLWSPRNFTAKGTKAALLRIEFFRCLLNQRNIEAAPVLNQYARSEPTGPGSCYAQ
eukprot:c24127_g1_i1 orf=442-2091(-)